MRFTCACYLSVKPHTLILIAMAEKLVSNISPIRIFLLNNREYLTYRRCIIGMKFFGPREFYISKLKKTRSNDIPHLPFS